MQTVTSNDGTRIAYDRHGSGPVVILVGGALGYRKFSKMEELAGLLAERGLTVVNYDRRGRGDSTEATPFDHATALEREIEDIAALIEAEGGSASLWGWSSGGALALRAAAALPGVERVSVYEVPFMVDPTHNRPTPDYGERLDELVAADDRNGLVKHFMRNAIGIPAPFVARMRLMPMWKGLKATSHTLPLRLGGARQAHDVRRAAPLRGVGAGRGPGAGRLRRRRARGCCARARRRWRGCSRTPSSTSSRASATT